MWIYDCINHDLEHTRDKSARYKSGGDENSVIYMGGECDC